MLEIINVRNVRNFPFATKFIIPRKVVTRGAL